jgi:ribonucleoside-triphosphate reductase
VVTSLNLPYIAMENNPTRSLSVFFNNLNHYLEIANRNMVWRVNHVAKIKAKVCPILWQYGGLATLDPEDTLESLVYGGYATVTLGYSGLYEAVKYLTGEGHWEENGNRVAHQILDKLNENNKDLGDKINVSVALYGTPAETLTDKFAKACIRDFGHVGDGTQRKFETNSYHYPVFEKIDAFEKLSFETQFSEKTLGGSISYVEVPNLSNNIDAMLELIEHIGNNCLYAEINSEISHCSCCGFQGYDFLKVAAEDGTVRWKCPQCGETDPSKVKTSYRICGYISNYTPTEGRSEDIMNRVKHLN